jgi:ABC-type proline/glycine betaine transport system ATPase subunit
MVGGRSVGAATPADLVILDESFAALDPETL